MTCSVNKIPAAIMTKNTCRSKTEAKKAADAKKAAAAKEAATKEAAAKAANAANTKPDKISNGATKAAEKAAAEKPKENDTLEGPKDPSNKNPVEDPQMTHQLPRKKKKMTEPTMLMMGKSLPLNLM